MAGSSREKDVIGIVLPYESKYVKDLSEEHMPLVAYLHGVRDPKRELPDYAYLWVTPNGIRPVIRGHWGSLPRGCRRVDVAAGCGPANGWFAAWLVDEQPRNIVTLEEYTGLERDIRDKEEELRLRTEMELNPLRERFESAALLVE